MGPQARREYLARMRERYETADRAAKNRLLNGVCEVTGYQRKAAIRLLRRRAGAQRRERGRPIRYGPVVVGTLRRIREAAGYPWSVRLKALLPIWLPWAIRRWPIADDVAVWLRTMSPRQMDRALRPFKKGAAETTEIDLVAHTGDRADGELVVRYLGPAKTRRKFGNPAYATPSI